MPDIYQGDEGWSFNLVDPDNRRPVDWEALAREPDEKQRLVRAVLAERIEGEYEAVEAGDGVCAFTRGRHLIGVGLRPGRAVRARGRLARRRAGALGTHVRVAAISRAGGARRTGR